MDIIIGTETITFNEAKQKALEWDMYSIRDWTENFLLNKISNECDKIILSQTSKNLNTLSYNEKLNEISASGIDFGSGAIEGYNLEIIVKSGEVINLNSKETKALQMTEKELAKFIENNLKVKALICIDRIAQKEAGQIENLSLVEKETLVTDSSIISLKEKEDSQ